MNTKSIAIIGGGLAGVCAAWSLARRGAIVTLFERESEVATKASGNHDALLVPYLGSGASAFNDFYSRAFEFSSSFIKRFLPDAKTGALQLPSTDRITKLIRERTLGFIGAECKVLGQGEASVLAGVTVHNEAVYVPDACLLNPRALVERLLASSENISVLCGTRVTGLDQFDDRWRVAEENGSETVFNAVVVAAAWESGVFVELEHLPLEAVRGQTILSLPTKQSTMLRLPVAFGGYIAPVRQGKHFVGASFRHGITSLESSPAETEEILTRLKLTSAAFEGMEASSARVCFRCSTHDRLPLIGPVLNAPAIRDEAARYRSGTDLSRRVTQVVLPNLYVTVGHGSRGLASCPLAGEVLGHYIFGGTAPFPLEIVNLVSPRRVFERLLL